ncbi:hypothetical protein [Janthinobacterium sp. PAMC25594]|uniref:hypothetical protein n=1 Tax=Janthinobacterium sp. PAMC25594 TaxID=2861284 RepID=UPI001C6287CF|nr:hypothetical protein [Janthinobacterium sp. PAMC25594]QYG09826.1 hypothetical protein KY494_14445 [Janthinobacterium sp. PAMC25594]
MDCPNANNLGTSQKDMLNRIIQAGAVRGFSGAMIDYALKSAFIESSLGDQLGARAGTGHVGIFQYDQPTWNSLHHTGSITSVDAQISAFYDDMNKYSARYNALAPSDRGNLGLEQYMYLKHHDGNSYTNWANSPGVKIFNNACFEPHVHTRAEVGDAPPGPGTDHMFDYLAWWQPHEKEGIVTVVFPIEPNPPATEDGDETA